MSHRFLQIHFLTSYPAALLNRDDAGFAKRLPFGGATRTRISSQCLKRHWRTFDGDHSLATIPLDGDAAPMSVRSRRTFERFVYSPLVEDFGVPEEVARATTKALMDEVLGKSEKAKAQAKEEAEEGGAVIRTGQVTVLGRPEVSFLLEQARAIAATIDDPKKSPAAVKERFKGESKKNLAALRMGAGLDAALFGRMITSDILARSNAAVHVAHAFTVHEESAETDYFSAVDDLLKGGEEEELGSGHIGTTELTSGFYYGYLVLDLPLLVSNLEGCPRGEWRQADRSLAAQVTSRLVHLVATVSPGAKLGSTAPYARPHLVLVEAGTEQPRTLANAFLKPVQPRPDLVANSYDALAGHLGDLDQAYGRGTARAAMVVGGADHTRGLLDLLDSNSSTRLDDLATWAAEQVEAA